MHIKRSFGREAVLLLKLLVLAGPILAFSSHGEIYLWKDLQGRHHYLDRKVDGATRLNVKAGYAYSRVKKVFDGDTLLLDDDRRVRLLGINSPEIETSRKDGEPLGEEAKLYLQSLVQKKKVRLEMDQTKYDKYQRILAHLFTEDGIHLNRELVEHGFAAVIIHPPDVMYTKNLMESQLYAEINGLGIWGRRLYPATPIRSVSQVKKRGWKRLRGKPQRLKHGRGYSRLLFSDKIDVRIPKKHLSYFPRLDDYLGKELEIRGWVTRRNDYYSVLVRHPSAIVIKETN